MAERTRVTSVMVASIPRLSKHVSLDNCKIAKLCYVAGAEIPKRYW
jgi:hypothetical protein